MHSSGNDRNSKPNQHPVMVTIKVSINVSTGMYACKSTFINTVLVCSGQHFQIMLSPLVVCGIFGADYEYGVKYTALQFFARVWPLNVSVFFNFCTVKVDILASGIQKSDWCCRRHIDNSESSDGNNSALWAFNTCKIVLLLTERSWSYKSC